MTEVAISSDLTFVTTKQVLRPARRRSFLRDKRRRRMAIPLLLALLHALALSTNCEAFFHSVLHQHQHHHRQHYTRRRPEQRRYAFCLRRQWRPLTVTSSSSDKELPPELQDLFRKVAADDPGWFQEYVVDSLGDSAIEVNYREEVIKPGADHTAMDEKEIIPPVAASKEIDTQPSIVAADDNKPLDALGELDLENALSVQQPAGDGMLFEEVTVVPKPPMSMASDAPDTIDAGEGVVDETVSSSAENITSESLFIASAITNPEVLADEEQSTDTTVPALKQDVSDDDVFTPTIGATLDPIKISTTADNSEAEAVIYSGQLENCSGVNQTLMVTFQPTFRRDLETVSLTTFTELQYSKDEVRMLNIDAIEMILDERRPRPKIGIPAGWRSATSVVEVHEPGQVEMVQLVTEKTMTARSSTGVEIKLEQGGNKSRPCSAKPANVANASLNNPPADERIVLFSDPSGRSWGSSMLSELHKLGYTTMDVESLDPGALNLILIEKLARPRKGIPSGWRLMEDSEAVKLLSQDQARDFLKDQEEQGRNKPTRRDSLKEDSSVERTKPARNIVGGGEPTQKARRPRGRMDRPMYDGRTQRKKSPRREDPPLPDSSFWPDIDKFRNLLRKEASLRLRILGQDFSDVVKKESDWRMDLYKNWLWTLHSGVGEPLVESRSDRLRKRQTEQSKRPRAAPTRRKRNND